MSTPLNLTINNYLNDSPLDVEGQLARARTINTELNEIEASFSSVKSGMLSIQTLCNYNLSSYNALLATVNTITSGQYWSADINGNLSYDNGDITVESIAVNVNLDVTGDASVDGNVSFAGWATTAQSSNYTASAGDFILADTSGGAWTVTLPASPSAGNRIRIKDHKASFKANNLTVDLNGGTILDDAGSQSSSDLICDVDSVDFELLFDGTDWVVL